MITHEDRERQMPIVILGPARNVEPTSAQSTSAKDDADSPPEDLEIKERRTAVEVLVVQL